MAQFNLDQYETVEDRLAKFWEDNPKGRVLTDIHYYDENRIVVRAEIYFSREDERPVATGYAEEVRGASPVNRTSHCENAETSAIGRGLANCGYQAKSAPRPSRQEMEKVERGPQQYSKPTTIKVHTETQVLKHDKTEDSVLNNVPEIIDAFNAHWVDAPKQEEPRSIAIKNPGEPASPKQIGMIRAMMKSQSMSKEDSKTYVALKTGREMGSLDELTKGEASLLITDLKG